MIQYVGIFLSLALFVVLYLGWKNEAAKSKEKILAQYQEDKLKYTSLKDAHNLDLVMRSEYHFKNAGKPWEKNSYAKTFDEVKRISPNYYPA